MYTIYCHTNTINGKMYVGQTKKTMEERWKQHIKDSRYRDFYFYRALREYGNNCWIHEVLEICSPQIANHSEAWWVDALDTFNNGYNSIRPDPDNKHYEMSESVKRKISIGNKGKIITNETKLKMGKSQKGRIHTEETKNKISQAHKGRIHKPLSEETKQKISKSSKGLKRTKETKNKMSKTYIITDPEGNEFEITNLNQWCKDNKMIHSNMCNVAKAKRLHHKGYKCRYKSNR